MASSRPHLQAENVILSFDSRNATPSQLSDSWRLSNVHSYRGNAMFGSDSPSVSAKTGSLKGEHPGIPGKRQSGSLRAAMRSSPQRAVNGDDDPAVDGQPVAGTSGRDNVRYLLGNRGREHDAAQAYDLINNFQQDMFTDYWETPKDHPHIHRGQWRDQLRHRYHPKH